uniref:Uncharacterized protein LOC116951612 isoform X1 n=1 Tax=Petromyzon marinus TaxID=7757 RepID=A0AAJ7TYA1_PETMA|nr:uncharacterized protein LOC116951612 isoform X1 [Petromyzon marinus]
MPLCPHLPYLSYIYHFPVHTILFQTLTHGYKENRDTQTYISFCLYAYLSPACFSQRASATCLSTARVSPVCVCALCACVPRCRNVLDWVVLLALLAALVTHVADVIGPSAALARTHVRLAAVAIVPLWMCNLKQMRSFWVIGPFIVMLGKMAVHFFKLLFLLLQFFVPYSIAFLLVFHNSGIQTLASGHMTAFQVLRLGFTDEYEALAMLAYAPLMTPLLVVSYVGLVSIVCLNIFVAMLNDAYESVSEDPRANMYMQRASVLLGLEKSVLLRGDREVTRRFLHNECSPLHAFYGHERVVQTEFELLTAACEIQDGLEELWEYVRDDHTNGGTKEMSFTTRPQSPRPFPSGSLSSVCQEVLDIHWQLDLLRMEQRDTTAHLKYMLRNLHQRLNAYTPIGTCASLHTLTRAYTHVHSQTQTGTAL